MVNRFESIEDLKSKVENNESFGGYNTYIRSDIVPENGRIEFSELNFDCPAFFEQLKSRAHKIEFVFKAKETNPTDTTIETEDGDVIEDTGKWIFIVLESGICLLFWCDENWVPRGGHHEVRVNGFGERGN